MSDERSAKAIDIVARDVDPGDAEAIVGIVNPIVEARVYAVFDVRASRRRSFAATFEAARQRDTKRSLRSSARTTPAAPHIPQDGHHSSI